MVDAADLALERIERLRLTGDAERLLGELRTAIEFAKRRPGKAFPKSLPHIQDSHLDTQTLRSIFLSASSGRPTTTAGCDTLTVMEVAAQRDIVYLSFPNSGKTYAWWRTRMPPNWDGGDLHVLGYSWTTPAASGTVVWGISGTALTDGLALSTALGSEVETQDDSTGADEQQQSRRAEGLLTLGGNPRPTDSDSTTGVRVLFVVSRDASHGDDDLADEARLEEVYIAYNTVSYSDLPGFGLQTLSLLPAPGSVVLEEGGVV